MRYVALSAFTLASLTLVVGRASTIPIPISGSGVYDWRQGGYEVSLSASSADGAVSFTLFDTGNSSMDWQGFPAYFESTYFTQGRAMVDGVAGQGWEPWVSRNRFYYLIGDGGRINVYDPTTYAPIASEDLDVVVSFDNPQFYTNNGVITRVTADVAITHLPEPATGVPVLAMLGIAALVAARRRVKRLAL